MTRSPRAFPTAWTRAGGVLALLLCATPASGQVATVRVEENFRAEPNGTIVARVLPGTELAMARVRGNWVETELEGWVWARSLRRTDREGRDLVVSASGGENLRGEPQGRVRARLVQGGLLDELGRRPGWIRVRRVGWIWRESVGLTEAGSPESADAREEVGADGPQRAAGEGTSAFPGSPGEAGGARSAASDSAAESTGTPRRSGAPAGSPTAPGVLTVPDPGLPILSTPDGDTLARAEPGRDVPVLARRGGWARVRVDGWVWVGTEPRPGADSASVPLTVGPGDVVREPERYRGRLVTWTLQFVSLETAERVRTDFYEGEPFLLTRPPGGEGAYVYVAVPPDRLPDLEDLTALETVEVSGRIRTGASELTGSPILDLVELRRRARR